MSEPNWQDYRKYAARLLEKGKVPCAQVAVAVSGKEVYSEGFGYRDVERKVAPDLDTIFGIGSITKSFTAVGIMQLEEQGKLCVSDYVTKYLPEFRFGKSGAEKHMTIHHFLTHTAGMPPLPSLNRTLVRSLLKDFERQEGPELTGRAKKAYEKQVESIKTLTPIDTAEELLEFIAEVDVPPLGPPGERFSYSNDSYALLGIIIERVSGEKYEDYITRHILEPAGMVHSSFDSYKTDNVAVLYNSRQVKGKTVVYPSPLFWTSPSMSAAGFLRSTARDMLRYMEIFRTGGRVGDRRILSEESVEKMISPQVRIPGGSAYGYGLIIQPNYKGVSIAEHGGNLKGVSAQASCIPERGITGVALTNLQSAPGPALLLGAMNVVLGVPVSSARFIYPRFEMAPELLKRYEGTFVSGEGASVKVSARGDRLVLKMQQRRLIARPTGLDSFAVWIKGSQMPATFLRDQAGDIAAVHLGYRMIPKVRDKEKN